MLLQIRDYICREGVVSTQQLARAFCLDFQALQPMLDLWVRRGVIRRCQEQKQCNSTCFKCQTKVIEYYQYLL